MNILKSTTNEYERKTSKKLNLENEILANLQDCLLNDKAVESMANGIKKMREMSRKQVNFVLNLVVIWLLGVVTFLGLLFVILNSYFRFFTFSNITFRVSAIFVTKFINIHSAIYLCKINKQMAWTHDVYVCI